MSREYARKVVFETWASMRPLHERLMAGVVAYFAEPGVDGGGEALRMRPGPAGEPVTDLSDVDGCAQFLGIPPEVVSAVIEGFVEYVKEQETAATDEAVRGRVRP